MNILVGDSKEKEFNLYGYTEEDFEGENTNEYLYGKLNKEVEYTTMKGSSTDTAKVTISDDNTISVDVKKTPESLTLTKGAQILGVFDGSKSMTLDVDCIDENLYVSKKELGDITSNINEHIAQERTARIKGDELLQTNIDNLSNSIDQRLENTNKRIDNNSARIVDTNNRIDLVDQKITQNYNDLNKLLLGIQTEFNSKIRQEIQDRKDADNNLESRIDDKLATKLDKANADKAILKDINIDVDGDNISLDASYINLNTQQETSNSKNIILASDNNAGLMSTADYKTIRDLKERVEGLESKTTRLLYTDKTNPSAQEIDDFVTAQGYKSPFEGIAVVIDKTFHIWHYYENDNIGWKDDGLDTVSTFTNDIAGIIKGSTSDGKVYAETDGTGSVYGWDTLKNRVSTNEKNIDLNISHINDLSNRLDLEKSAREAADKQLQNNINANTTRIDNLKDDLDKEISDRQIADTTLQTNINSVNTNLKKAIADEKDRAQLEEANLLSKLNSEISNRKTADSQLQSQIDDEVARAQLSELNLDSKINTEITNRTNADQNLKDQIDALDTKLSSYPTKDDVQDAVDNAAKITIRRWRAE